MARLLLRVSADDSLRLPIEAVTQTFVVFGKRESGKTNGATVMVEEMLNAGAHVVVCDPVGAWYGIRSSIDGKGPGFPIPILGGEHGDVPFDPGAGALVADLVVDERVSAVLDLSEMDPPQMIWCMTDFCERLYRRNRSPLHIVFEEADEIAPERQRHLPRAARVPHEYTQDRLLWAVSRIVRKGRSPRGLGCTLITQRSSVISKDVISQPDTLIAYRTIAPTDMAAIDAWVRRHGDEEKRAELLRTLPTLAAGTAWVWSPGWLGIFRKVAFRRRATFDSGATPKVGHLLRKPRTLAEIDLSALKRRMAEAIDRKRETDPVVLRQRLVETQDEIRRLREDADHHAIQAPKAFPNPAARTPLSAPVAVPDKRLVVRLERTAKHLSSIASHGRAHARAIIAVADQAATAYNAGAAKLETVTRRLSDVMAKMVATQRPASSAGETPVPAVSQAPVRGDVKLGAPERKLLSALAQYPEGLTIRQLALLTGYRRTGGAFKNPLGRLRSAGFAEGRDPVRITNPGRAALGQIDALPPPGRPLLQYWMQRLGSPEREILRVLAEAQPMALSPDEVASRMISSRGTPYTPTGGAFKNPLGRVRTLGLVEGRSDLTLARSLVESAQP